MMMTARKFIFEQLRSHSNYRKPKNGLKKKHYSMKTIWRFANKSVQEEKSMSTLILREICCVGKTDYMYQRG
jgi:hypothetical protein